MGEVAGGNGACGGKETLFVRLFLSRHASTSRSRPAFPPSPPAAGARGFSGVAEKAAALSSPGGARPGVWWLRPNLGSRINIPGSNPVRSRFDLGLIPFRSRFGPVSVSVQTLFDSYFFSLRRSRRRETAPGGSASGFFAFRVYFFLHLFLLNLTIFYFFFPSRFARPPRVSPTFPEKRV